MASYGNMQVLGKLLLILRKLSRNQQNHSVIVDYIEVRTNYVGFQVSRFLMQTYIIDLLRVS